MADTTFETKYILDHERRRALLVTLTASPPVAHNVAPVSFCFYIRSKKPYFTSKAHFDVVQNFCTALAKYVDASGFFERTIARVVQLYVFDARDPPRPGSGPWTFEHTDVKAMRHNQDFRVWRHGQQRMKLGYEYFEQSTSKVESWDEAQTILSEVVGPWGRDRDRLSRKSIKFHKSYKDDTLKSDTTQLLSDEDEWPHPGPGDWVVGPESPLALPPPAAQALLSHLMGGDLPAIVWKGDGPPNPYPEGHILHPETKSSEPLLPHESSFSTDDDPFKLVIFFIDPAKDDPIGNSRENNGLRTCFFGAREKKLALETTPWDDAGQEPKLRDLLLEVLPEELRKEPDLEEISKEPDRGVATAREVRALLEADWRKP